MDRRRFLLTSLTAVAAPLTAEAQQAASLPRIGFIAPASLSDPRVPSFLQAFRQGLRELGYVEGQNIAIEFRWAEGQYDRLPGLAAELVRLKVNVIVAAGPNAIQAAKQATETIPIVMAAVADPVATGFVASLARPGGNITGISNMMPELVGKHRSEIDSAFAAITTERAGAVIVLADTVLLDHRTRIADHAVRRRLPMVSGFSEFAEAGGLLAYGPSLADGYRRAAAYVVKILKGAKPADLPVAQPATFELVINLKAAKALGVTIPQSVLARADHVIE
jgi:putative ABC transport system substrate-binding protein